NRGRGGRGRLERCHHQRPRGRHGGVQRLAGRGRGREVEPVLGGEAIGRVVGQTVPSESPRDHLSRNCLEDSYVGDHEVVGCRVRGRGRNCRGALHHTDRGVAGLVQRGNRRHVAPLGYLRGRVDAGRVDGERGGGYAAGVVRVVPDLGPRAGPRLALDPRLDPACRSGEFRQGGVRPDGRYQERASGARRRKCWGEEVRGGDDRARLGVRDASAEAGDVEIAVATRFEVVVAAGVLDWGRGKPGAYSHAANHDVRV